MKVKMDDLLNMDFTEIEALCDLFAKSDTKEVFISAGESLFAIVRIEKEIGYRNRTEIYLDKFLYPPTGEGESIRTAGVEIKITFTE